MVSLLDLSLNLDLCIACCSQFACEPLDRLVVHRRASLGCIDQRLQTVGRFEQQIGDRRRHHFLSVAKQVEQGLHLMGELRDGIKSEHSAGALDGMGRAENFVQQIQVLGMLLERQQSFFDDGQMIAGFFEKCFLKLPKIVVHTASLGVRVELTSDTPYP